VDLGTSAAFNPEFHSIKNKVEIKFLFPQKKVYFLQQTQIKLTPLDSSAENSAHFSLLNSASQVVYLNFTNSRKKADIYNGFLFDTIKPSFLLTRNK
jgi:hypothetical protein